MTHQIPWSIHGKTEREQGYSLLELSMVIIIMGLMVTGATYGISLVRQGNLRAIIKKVEEFRTGFNTFEQTYKGQPGDLYNAKNFWPASENGSGDGQVVYETTAGSNNEALRAWQQMSLAKVISGNFTGVAASAQAAVPGVNVPKADINTNIQSGYFIHYSGWLGNASRNIVVLGGTRAGTWNDTISVSPSDAIDLDEKIDDGAPGTGLVWTQGGRNMGNTAYSGNCINGNDSTATYRLSVETPECQVAFVLE